jgi:metal iron transporter
MNCPSRTDPNFPEGYNQNPDALNADATTRADLGYMANTRARDNHRIDCYNADEDMTIDRRPAIQEDGGANSKAFDGLRRRSDAGRKANPGAAEAAISSVNRDVVLPKRRGGLFGGAIEVIRNYLKFVGPGFMVAVAYIDPGKSYLHALLEHLYDRAMFGNYLYLMKKADSNQETTLPMLLLVPLSSSSCFSSC